MYIRGKIRNMAKQVTKKAPAKAAVSVESVKSKLDDVMKDLDTLAAGSAYPARFQKAKRDIINVCRINLKA